MPVIANSTKKGAAVSTFPDVCSNVPSGPAPVPIPYPNIAKTNLPPALVAAGIGVAGGSYKQSDLVVAQSMRTKLHQLNQQLTSLPGNDPNHWHELVDEYVQVTASLYRTLAMSKGAG